MAAPSLLVPVPLALAAPFLPSPNPSSWAGPEQRRDGESQRQEGEWQRRTTVWQFLGLSLLVHLCHEDTSPIQSSSRWFAGMGQLIDEIGLGGNANFGLDRK